MKLLEPLYLDLEVVLRSRKRTTPAYVGALCEMSAALFLCVFSFKLPIHSTAS